MAVFVSRNESSDRLLAVTQGLQVLVYPIGSVVATGHLSGDSGSFPQTIRKGYNEIDPRDTWRGSQVPGD